MRSAALRWALAVQEQVEQLADGAFPADRVPQHEVLLDLVAVATAVTFLHDIPSAGEIGDDAVGRALGDVDREGKIAQPSVGLSGDEEDGAGVIGQEAPVAHGVHGRAILETVCKVLDTRVNFRDPDEGR